MPFRLDESLQSFKKIFTHQGWEAAGSKDQEDIFKKVLGWEGRVMELDSVE